ncbi:MAG: hypothetical protein JWO05_3464 [Gemmatimonadetes bacterium]|nr:hypothetical protein [Gemmatimonadota bacterium]
MSDTECALDGSCCGPASTCCPEFRADPGAPLESVVEVRTEHDGTLVALARATGRVIGSWPPGTDAPSIHQSWQGQGVEALLLGAR